MEWPYIYNILVKIKAFFYHNLFAVVLIDPLYSFSFVKYMWSMGYSFLLPVFSFPLPQGGHINLCNLYIN